MTTTEGTTKAPISKTGAKVETFEIIPLDQIGSDASYQRYVSMNYVQQLVDQWDPRACGPLLVSRRKNGAIFVVDGQHRLEALKLLGEAQVMARIANSLSTVEEAEIRMKTQFVKPERAWERFKARIAARDPEAIQITKLLRTAGAQLQMEPYVRKGQNVITSVRSVENIYGLDKGFTLTSLINLLMETFGEVNVKNAKAPYLRALAWFLFQHPDADREALIRLLRQDLHEIEKRARATRSTYGTGSLWTAIYQQLCHAYNKTSGVEKVRADIRGSTQAMGSFGGVKSMKKGVAGKTTT